MGNSISTAVDANGKIIIIDFDKLKRYERLEDATVFKTLFKINEESSWGDFPMYKNNDGQITLLQFLDITNNDWFNLMQFLENGLIKINHITKNDNIELVENINLTCQKLGGIPSFEKFYKGYYEGKLYNNGIENEIYNPTCPEEDVKELYYWDLERDTNSNNFRVAHTIENGWSVMKHYRLDHSVTDCIWWRKLKE